MVDVVDSATRSRMMAGIRSKSTQPELTIRKALHAQGFRYRLHPGNVPGHPDIALPRYRAAVFVNGCFWHGHDCQLFHFPATRPEFWREKIARNRLRDARVRTSKRGLAHPDYMGMFDQRAAGTRPNQCDREHYRLAANGGHDRRHSWPQRCRVTNSTIIPLGQAHFSCKLA